MAHLKQRWGSWIFENLILKRCRILIFLRMRWIDSWSARIERYTLEVRSALNLFKCWSRLKRLSRLLVFLAPMFVTLSLPHTGKHLTKTFIKILISNWFILFLISIGLWVSALRCSLYHKVVWATLLTTFSVASTVPYTGHSTNPGVLCVCW